jgi:DNA-binding response OmpR family regulator
VVEDDEPTRDAMTALLVQEDFLVLTAGTARDALAVLRQPLAPIDVVILDVRLPDVTGAVLCERLREMCPHVPVIVCTGEANTKEIARLLELGASRFFQKPISPEELVSTVVSALP